MKIRRGVFKSMRFTVFVSFLILTSAFLLIFGLVTENTYKAQLIDKRTQFVTNQTNKLLNQLGNSDYVSDDMTTKTKVQIEQLASVLDGRIMVVNSNFQVVLDTYCLDEGKYIIDPGVLEFLKADGKDKSNIFVDNKVDLNVEKSQFIRCVLPISTTVTEDTEDDTQTTEKLDQGKQKQTVIGAVIVSASVNEQQAIFKELHEKEFLLYTLFFIGLLIVAFVLTVMLTSHFREFTQSINQISDGKVDEGIMLHGYTEMKELAKAFNGVMEKMTNLETSRQEFVSNVSHELKTPITSIKVLAESLLGQEDIPVEMYREFMTDIVDEIDRENVIINDLLSLVKMDQKSEDALQVSLVNINDLVELLLKWLRPLAAKRSIEIVYETFRPVSAEVDEVKLSLAVSNLVENAIKYNKDEGYIRVSLNADHKYFYLKVADSGVGIPEDCQDQVFERFYRVDKARSRETGGTGLGLAITHRVIMLHNGSIKLYSKYGEGTTFTVRIPLKVATVIKDVRPNKKRKGEHQ